MSGQTVSYLRVSSTDQNLARQREIVGHVDREFAEHVSARSTVDRAQLAECIAYLREGDTLRVASIDRLARSLVDLRSLVDTITAKGAVLVFVQEGLAFSREADDPRATFMLGILGSLAEFERSLIRERQADGVALAKKAGIYPGRKRILTPQQEEEIRQRCAAGANRNALAREFGVSRATIFRTLAN